MERERNAWLMASESERQEIEALGRKYIRFLNRAKTERETVSYLKEELQENNFVDLKDLNELRPGQRVFIDHKGKAAVAAVIGEKPFIEGFTLSPPICTRLDLTGSLARMQVWLFRTTEALKKSGVFHAQLEGGEKLSCIGEEEDDPVLR